MPKINGIIATSSFELVRDQIGAILADEISNQFTLSAEEALNLSGVFIERVVPFDKTEMPAVNVSVARLDLDGQVAVNTDNNATYNIDCYQAAKSGDGVQGDVLSRFQLFRLMAVVRSILEDPQYITLDFARPFIMNRHVVSIEPAPAIDQDGINTAMGRVVLSVKVAENTDLVPTTILGRSDTTVKLELTDKGYRFIIDA